MEKGYTLITGASQGIGREMAKYCAQKGMNLLLVALPNEHLEDTVKEIETDYLVKVDHLAIDLCQLDAAQQVYDWTIQKGYEVHILINNAGFGDSGFFEDIPFQKTVNMLLLNNLAAVSMTHLFLPQMKKRGHGHIMGTSSIEGILIMPYKASYSATKRFIYSFFLALRQECKKAGVNVSVLCPGPVPTTPGAIQRIKVQGKKAEIITRSVDHVAEIAISKMLKKQGIIIPGRLLRTVVLGTWLIPFSIKMWFFERMSRRYADQRVEMMKKQVAVK